MNIQKRMIDINETTMKENNSSRRDFIKKSLIGAAAFAIVPRHVLGGQGFLAPSDHLTKGIIGTGSMGRGHFQYAGTKTVAICDVDSRHLALAQKALGGGVREYRDFRELIADKAVDIVHIATPPHWHGVMAVEAARSGQSLQQYGNILVFKCEQLPKWPLSPLPHCAHIAASARNSARVSGLIQAQPSSVMSRLAMMFRSGQ